MKYSETSITEISDLVSNQFPAFYKEQGPNFIAFVKAYYEWMEQEENIVGASRNLYSTFDIDTTPDSFLEHFKHKYMNGLPPEILGNQRFLQKHILELYRSKGSYEAVRLLFRLLYNEDIDFYIPSYDIFKLSDNTWIRPKYLEVDRIDTVLDCVGKMVRGEVGGATAVIESVEQKAVNGNVIGLIFLSNVYGEFQIGERVICEGKVLSTAPKILGSVTGLNILSSSVGFNVGDEVFSNYGDVPVYGVVNEVGDNTGGLNIRLVDGGSYYSMDAVIDISSGSNTQGSGADFIISEIEQEGTYLYISETLADYANTALDANSYGFPFNPSANLSSIIDESLEIQEIPIGRISQILVLSSGVNYDGDVTITVTDPYTSTSGILDGNGVQVGTNAIITGVPSFGDNVAQGVRIENSGFNIRGGNEMRFEYVNDPNQFIVATPIYGGMGNGEGYFDNTRSFLSDDKYLFDGHYYQDFSYVIRSSKMLDKYLEILKRIAHPAGNAVYGDIRIRTESELINSIEEIIIKIIPE